jgi:FG-GAP-like repeat
MGTINRLAAASILCSGLISAAAYAQQALPIPWLVPTFVHQPPNDSVVFGSLLEAAGYAIASNSNWVDIAAGNFCGGPEKELVLIKNAHSNFSILRGPVPFAIGSGDLASSSSHPWRAVAAGNLDGDAFDEIVAVRKVTSSGVPDLVVAKANVATCEVSTVIASATIGNPSNSEWVDAAVGDFTGTGRKQIALLKAAHSNFFFLKLTPAGELTVFHESDLDSNPTQPWKALAAGDLDGDGIDELIVARQVNDGHSATVLAYKWNGSGFSLFATSTFGNDGNSDWSSAAVGDFNGDGRNAIVLVKNQHSNFVVLDYPFGATQLRVLSTADLDSVEGQDWRGLAATNWLSADASQLIAVRAAHGDYHTDLFVYGDPFYRFARDTALDGTKGAWELDQQIEMNLKDRLSETHTNTFNWDLLAPGDYPKLVAFLNNTKDFFVDGKQLRVWVSLANPRYLNTDPTKFVCSLPEESPLTAWSEADFFSTGLGPASCKDYLGWASLIGRLARDFPQLVAVGLDDFFDSSQKGNPPVAPFTEDYIAEFESRMRSQAPWLNFVPTVYYKNFFNGNKWPDLALTFDTMIFYFRSEKKGGGLGDATINNAPDEFAEMSNLIPTGRKLQVGVYFGFLTGVPEASARYDYELVNLVLSLPWLGGTTAYPAQTIKPDGGCTELNFLDNKYCALMRAYGSKP